MISATPGTSMMYRNFIHSCSEFYAFCKVYFHVIGNSVKILMRFDAKHKYKYKNMVSLYKVHFHVIENPVKNYHTDAL